MLVLNPIYFNKTLGKSYRKENVGYTELSMIKADFKTYIEKRMLVFKSYLQEVSMIKADFKS